VVLCVQYSRGRPSREMSSLMLFSAHLASGVPPRSTGTSTILTDWRATGRCFTPTSFPTACTISPDANGTLDIAFNTLTSKNGLLCLPVQTGTFQIDVEPLDLLRAIAGVANVRHNNKWKDSAVRMVDLLLKGCVTHMNSRFGQSSESQTGLSRPIVRKKPSRS
jgi:hypothetical protein